MQSSAIPPTPSIEVHDLHFHYGDTCALKSVNLCIPENQVTAFIGPSGCGKSTLLRCFNRMNDEIAGARITQGSVHIGGIDIQHSSVDVVKLRREVGMIFQKSNPFPRSIYDNVAFGLQLHGTRARTLIEESVEAALRDAALWDEVKDRLHEPAFSLSGGQQQRLCIARSLAVKPRIILMDEPCSALDPIATAKIEDLIWDLKQQYTLIIVTHNMQQATRVSDHTAFFFLGELIEYSDTLKLFSNPSNPLTENYIRGTFS
jgi:phosphate transport system ATP-binding protein